MNKYKNIFEKITSEKQHIDNNILIIDGLNTFLRCFSVINMINPNGHHIGGLVGFLKSIGYAIKILDPTKVIIVFDGVGGSSSKRNLFPAYKSNRYANRITNYDSFKTKEEENEAIHSQIIRLIHYLKCLPLSIICIDGLEADDIIGNIVGTYEDNINTNNITVMSADKDFLQLVSEKTQIYSPSKKKVYKQNDVIDEYNVHPNNFIAYKVLLGDKSDNIPGIKGLGDKKLLKMFPELKNEAKFHLHEILEKSSKEKDNDLFAKINELSNQLQINNRLMNLKETSISLENLQIIKNNIQESNGLNKSAFNTMYNSDLLGDSIPHVDNWIYTVFNTLEIINKDYEHSS